MELNERIRMVRKDAKLTQKAFGEIIGVGNMAVTYYESGDRNPSQSTMKLIIEKFGINETWLLTGEGEMKAPVTREQEIAEITAQLFKDESSFRSQLIKLIAQMDADDMEMLRKYAVKLGEISKEQ